MTGGLVHAERRFSLLGAAVMPFALLTVFILIKMSEPRWFFPGDEPSWALAGSSCGVILLLHGLTRYKAAAGIAYLVACFFLLLGFSGLFLRLFYGVWSTPPY